MLKLIHRQVLKELLHIFFLSLGCLLGIILLGRMLQLRDILLAQNVGGMDLMVLFFYLVPFFLLMIMPIASMLAVFLTFLRMSTDRELVALKANGVSLYRMLPAPLIFALLCTAGALFISHYGISWGMSHFKGTLLELVRSQTRLALQAGIFNQDFPGLTFYAHKVDERTGAMEFVFVQDKRQKEITVNIVADQADVVTDLEQQALVISFTNGRIYRREGAKLDVLQFGSYVIRLSLAQLFGSGYNPGERKASELSVEELRLLQKDPEALEHIDTTPFKVDVELAKRFALPAGCFVLALFAMPIACVFQGLRQQWGLLLSLGLFMVYYTMFSFAVSLGETGVLDPRIGLWVPNILFIVIFILGLHLAAREKMPQFSFRLPRLRFRRAKS
ncbi:MAG: LPS export ABC transporter permease LptF [Desulfovibrio sp.]|nr:LPS export ABC transporter permease LptF [Desulfovibrio sp.]